MREQERDGFFSFTNVIYGRLLPQGSVLYLYGGYHSCLHIRYHIVNEGETRGRCLGGHWYTGADGSHQPA